LAPEVPRFHVLTNQRTTVIPSWSCPLPGTRHKASLREGPHPPKLDRERRPRKLAGLPDPRRPGCLAGPVWPVGTSPLGLPAFGGSHGVRRGALSSASNRATSRRAPSQPRREGAWGCGERRRPASPRLRPLGGRWRWVACARAGIDRAACRIGAQGPRSEASPPTRSAAMRSGRAVRSTSYLATARSRQTRHRCRKRA